MEKSDIRTTRNIILKNFGGYENIQICDSFLCFNDAALNKSDVQVAVSYCGVNFADIYQRKGLIPTITLPCILGLECTGVVVRIGQDVTAVKPGDRVLCYQGTGGLYRDTVILPDYCCFRIPDNISLVEAVALPANYLTAYICLFHLGNVKPGFRILIHSCAGGVGWAAVQIAKTIENVEVIGTASLFKHEAAQKNGVNFVIDSKDYYRCLQNDPVLKDKKFDVIIDTLGCSNISLSLTLLKSFGKVVVIGANSAIDGDGRLGILDFLKLFWSTKNINVTNLIMNNNCIAGFHLHQLLHSDPNLIRSIVNILFDMVHNKLICPKIDSVWPFDQFTNAMELLSTRNNIGKVILKI